MKRAGMSIALGVLLAIASPSHAATSTDAMAPYARLAQRPDGKALLAIARDAMEAYWQPPMAPSGTARAQTHDAPPAIDWPGPPAGLYVSLVRGHQTRACVGSASAPRSTLTDAVRTLAVEALRSDRRRAPVRYHELAELSIVLSFVVASETVADPMRIDPGRDGLLVTSPRGAVAFLPGEARTVRWALDEARRIGVLRSGSGDASYERLHVVTMSEPPRPTKTEESPDEVP